MARFSFLEMYLTDRHPDAATPHPVPPQARPGDGMLARALGRAQLTLERAQAALDTAHDREQVLTAELADRRVLRSIASDPGDTVPARRPITVRDLLTFTMGFGSVMAPPDTFPIQRGARRSSASSWMLLQTGYVFTL